MCIFTGLCANENKQRLVLARVKFGQQQQQQ